MAWLTVPATADSLPLVRERLADRLRRLGRNGSAHGLAVNEAVSNSVRHACPGGAGTVGLDLSEADDTVAW